MARRTGAIVRRLGRMVVPKEVRDSLRLGRNAQLAFAADGDPAVLGNPDLKCVFCGTREHVLVHRGQGICVDCVREVRELVSGG
jgi:hypothetical protein